MEIQTQASKYNKNFPNAVMVRHKKTGMIYNSISHAARAIKRSTFVVQRQCEIENGIYEYVNKPTKQENQK